MSCHTGPHGEATGLVRRQKEVWGKPRPEPLMRLASVGKARQGRGSHLGLATLNSAGRLWVTEMISSCLVPGPR